MGACSRLEHSSSSGEQALQRFMLYKNSRAKSSKWRSGVVRKEVLII